MSISNTGSQLAEKNNLLGILWMVLFAISMTGMHTSIRYVTESIHPFEVAFFRLVFGMLAIIPFFYQQGLSVLKTNRLPMLTTRGVVNAVCMLGYFYALSIGPLARVTALGFTATLFAIVISIFVFREKLGLRRWSAILLGFAGTLVIVRPGFAEIGLETIVTLAAAFGWGICIVIVKDLGKTESAATITAYMSLVMAPIVLIPALFFWTTPSWTELFWLVLVGLFGGVGQLAMAYSLKAGEAAVVLPVEFTRLIWISIAAYIFFAEVPGYFVWIGGAMIMLSTSYITLRESQLKKKTGV